MKSDARKELLTEDPPLWHGEEHRECGEHRTVGAHRAWCHDDGEWCYPAIPCRGCELPKLRALLKEALGIVAYVSCGRQYVGTAPYPDALARRLNAEIRKALS